MSPLLPSSRQPLRAVVALLLCAWLPAETRAASALESIPAKAAEAMQAPRAALSSFLDRLPELPDLGLPTFDPSGSVRLFFRPRFGDLLHEDYFRLPVGTRLKLNDNFEFNAELGAYITHGLKDSVGNGLYQFRTGMKYEQALSADAGWTVGLDWVTPLSRPPYEITDGVRHTLPYVTFTRTVMPRYGLVGFATLGADFIDHTSLRENYRENQLHSNNLILTLGVARQWRGLNLILKVFDANTAPLSGGSDNVFGIRPSVGIPLLRRHNGTPRATATFEGRTIWGPDGFETGVTTSVRVDLRYRRNRADK